MNSKIIYSIYKATNIINGKCYIGYTEDYNRRLLEHKRKSKSLDFRFYRAIRQYGWNNFQWSIIYQSFDGEYTLRIMEPYFIEQYNSYRNGYNDTKGGDYSGNIKEWVIMDPNGNIFEIENLHLFCRDYKLNAGIMNAVAIGKTSGRHNKGWQCRYKGDNRPFYNPKELIKSYKIIDPNGKEYITNNTRQFCRDNNLQQSVISRIINGERKQYKGWTAILL